MNASANANTQAEDGTDVAIVSNTNTAQHKHKEKRHKKIVLSLLHLIYDNSMTTSDARFDLLGKGVKGGKRGRRKEKGRREKSISNAKRK